jgi:hypothetical protein
VEGRSSGTAGDISTDWITDRLDQQIHWYSSAARRSRIGYLITRLFTLLAAAVITVVSITNWAPPGWQPTWLPGILGAGIVLFEGIQGLFRWRDQWLMYRATAEGLKREQSLYSARAGPYVDATSSKALAVLAERAEDLMASENMGWRQLHEQAGEPPSSSGSPETR